jgi:hypothetical protein
MIELFNTRAERYLNTPGQSLLGLWDPMSGSIIENILRELANSLFSFAKSIK